MIMTHTGGENASSNKEQIDTFQSTNYFELAGKQEKEELN
jgi:hypothetical protein